ncbi:A-kinase anchor protein 13-like isoform X3 [Micropterus salmoides]|uniref:A-kinase anchor protein 13-like isoform X3 n=1 Tax=Micropterus salmoides TaxID=27706 RepID=UPI0018EDD7DC|nr:A-kinase anchor protein 13-like isoform X3 [Micropterus salmoides]
MKLNPQQAPLYGECLLTVQLDDDDVCRAEGEQEEVEFFLLLSGSTQRHLTSTLRVSHVTLQAVCPGHNVCEQVSVTLCLARPGEPVDTYSQVAFCFVQDLALDMAHLLLDNTAPQEALLLTDKQIPLKECERLDHSLALALKHLTLPRQTTVVDRQMGNQPVSVTATDINAHTNRHNTRTHKETWLDGATLLDSCSAVSQCRQLSNLLHLAATYGLGTVASFLLQQPGGREALRRPNTQGLTPACLAESRGHQQLKEFFSQYETSSDVQVETKEQPHFYTEGRVFQHHAKLGTYTLTFPDLHQREGGAETKSGEDFCLQEEVKELRRLIHLHRDRKRKSDLAGNITPPHTSTSSSIDHEQASPACGLQPCSNGQQESKQDVGLAVVTIENCITTTKDHRGPPLLEDKTRGADSTVVTQTSCASGSLCQSQEAGGEQKGAPAANSPARRNRKNKKRTTRNATESLENKRCTQEGGRGIARRPTKTPRSRTEIHETISVRQPAGASVIGDREATKTQCSPGTEETPLPIKPVTAPGGDRKCAGRKTVALPTTTIIEKQEGEKWEVDLLICERVVETETEQGDPAKAAKFNLGSAAEKKVTMGQEQSQDPQESQSDPEEPSQPDTMNKSPQSGRRISHKSPDMERNPRRGLWRDGGWIGGRMGSTPHEPQTGAKTVWYEGENLEQGVHEDWNRKDVNSQSVWYDSDTVDQRKHEQLEQGLREQKECDLSSLHASGLSSPQLLEQGLSSHQLSAALSQPLVAGPQPALSHGPSAQKREVHGSQQGEEVGLDQKEGGVEGDREEVGNRETTYSRKSSETADIEEGGEEKKGSEEKGTKSRKKRKKKKGKRGDPEAKLSSSSSIESQSQIDVQTQREQVTNLDIPSKPEAKDKTGRADVQFPCGSEPSWRVEADKDAMHLPSQTEGQTREAHGSDCDITNSDPCYTTSEFSLTDLTEGTASQIFKTKKLSEDETRTFHEPDDFYLHSTVTASELSEVDIIKAKVEETATVQPIGKDVLDPTELELKGLTSPGQQTADNAESKALSENEDLPVAGKAAASVDRTGFLESNSPEELPVKHSDPTEFAEEPFLGVLPEHNTQHVQPLDSKKPVQPVDPIGRPVRFMEAGDLPIEGTADVSPLEIQEGRAETTPREYLEHCLASEMLKDQEQKRNELWVGEEEVSVERHWERRSEDRNDSGAVHGKELTSIDRGEKVEDEDCHSLQREKEQNYNEDLVATAVAIVTVAMASAIVSIELSQQLADNQLRRQESASKEPANNPPLAQDTNEPIDTSHQLADDLLNTAQATQLCAQLINKDKENCQLLAMTPTDTESQHREWSHIEPTDQFTSKEQVNVEILKQSDSVVSQCNTETEKLLAAPLSSNQQANLDLSAHTPSLPQLCKEDIQSKLFTYSLPKEEDSLLQVNMKPFPEVNKMITAEVDGQGHMQTEIQLQEEIQVPCPIIDTGQLPEASDTFCPDSDENPRLGERRDPPRSVCQNESDRQHLDSHCPHSTKHDRDAKGEEGMQVHEHDSVHQLDGQITSPCEGEIPTLPLSCGSLPVTPCDSAPLEEPAVNVDTGEYQSSWSLAEIKPVPAIPFDTGSGKCQESVAMDNEDVVFEGLDKDSVDTVDGRTERDINKMKSEKEVQKAMVTVEGTSQTEAETVPAAKEDCQQAWTDSDSAHILQIQRERDVLYPVQPCPEANTVIVCTDIHPDREDCVSVCLLHRDKGSLKASAELDDSHFKKPKDPPPCVGHRDRGVHVSCSSTDDALIQGTLCPSEGALSAGTSDAVVSQSSRLSWKLKTEDRGGGGGEEEKKDQLLQSPVSSPMLPASMSSLSPFRRHSWEPGRNNAAADNDIAQRSSLMSLSGEAKRAKPLLHRRSYSLEGLEVERVAVRVQCPSLRGQEERTAGRSSLLESQERGSLVSLTEEEQEGDGSSVNSQVLSVTASCPAMFHHQTLTKSISMVTISQRDIDGGNLFSSNSGSLEYSISEEEPGPLRSDTEVKGGPKFSRTFSYLRSKMSKKGKEKERRGERERESKEREKKSANGHLFFPVNPSPSTACQHCTKLLYNKESFICNNCGVHVHKCCRESLSICTKSKIKQSLVPEAAPGSAANMRSKSTSSASSVSSTSSSSSRERWSTITTPDDQLPVVVPRRHPSIFSSHSNLAKSISISNIAGLDDVPLKSRKFLSQSTDSLHQGSKVNASMESLTDEGTEMMDSQLMGEFECDMKDLEADSWSGTVDKKFLKMLKKDDIKKQDVIYELYQTEFHHVRTLKIMSEVYYKGLQKELQLDTHTLEKIFPVLDNLLDIHTHFLTLLLERKRASSAERQNNNSFLICSIGDVLVNQFSGCSADLMKKVYGKFCSRHNEAVSLYKDMHAKDKRFQAFIKRIMSSSIVRRLSIPECILLVTQRITKYPVLIQRILQYTKNSDEDHNCVCEALRCVKELITAVDSKVNEQEKKQRLREVYSRTDSKSIMRMKSGQMFAKEDLIRGRKLLHDGALQLKNSAGRLKDVHAMLLTDVLVFLQEKDQKYVFASLDQRSTVVSLQGLIVREVANEERGLFLITAGIERPEMVEVLASSKDERNTWMAIIQDAMHCMEKDVDEGVPSETEEDRRLQENRAKEIREILRRKDEQIISLLEEKVHIFRELGDCNIAPDDINPPVKERMLFRATPDDVTKGEPIIKDALKELETLQALVNSGVGGAECSLAVGLTGGSVGPVSLPRRAETFGGFDSHQMNSSKNGEKEEGDDSLDLRRTESDSILKKGATASLQIFLKRYNEQVKHSVTYLHDLLISLQAVVVQQDSFIEDQRQALTDQLTANSSRHSFSSSLSSSSSSRPSSLIEQEKHRSVERQRQEAASLQKQQAAHQEEKRRREKVWELKEKGLAEREERLRVEEDETRRKHRELTEDREMLQRKKEEYQRELEMLREARRRLERDTEALRRDTDSLEAMKRDQSEQLQKYQRTPSTTSEDSIIFHSSGSLNLDSKEAAEQPKEVELSSSAPTKELFLRIGSKRMGKNFNPFSSSKPQGAQKESQLPTRLLQLAKPKENKDKKKKKKKGKGGEQTQTESKVMSDPQNDGDIFFC